MSYDPEGDDHLYRAARRVAGGASPSIAGLVLAWSRTFPEESPADALACVPRAVTELSLCLRPREARWLGDVAEIAGAVGLDLDRLASFLRTCEAIERLGDAHPVEGDAPARMLAARDRDEDA